MARARNIKPGFFKNEDLCELSPLARLLFAGLWTLADREGRLEDRPKRIKPDTLPYDKCNIDELLQSLHDNGFILRYQSDGHKYIQIITWNKHQNPHVKEGASTIPAPYLHHAGMVLQPEQTGAGTGNSGASPADSLIPSSLIPSSHDSTGRRRFDPFDEAFPLFREAGEKYGWRFSETEWYEFERFTWVRQNIDQKLSAIKGLNDRIEAQDFSLVNATPKNYCEKSMYVRRIRDPTVRSISERQSEKEKAIERKMRERGELGGIQNSV